MFVRCCVILLAICLLGRLASKPEAQRWPNASGSDLSAVWESPPGAQLWDVAVPGFGVRRQKSAAVAYVLLYRTADGRQRWHTIGRHGAPWTPETARAEARRLLGEVVKGSDPMAEKQDRRRAATVTELCDLYPTDAEAGHLMTRRRTPKKPSTLRRRRGPDRAGISSRYSVA